MSNFSSGKKKLFNLPPKESLVHGNLDDPLRYYYHPLVGFLFCSRVEQALSLLSPPYESVLEIGYGSGIIMPALSSIGKRVYGIDVNSDRIKVTKNLKKLGVDVELSQGDFIKAPYSDESFDLVVAISIFEHINNLKEAISKAYCILKPGGHLLVGMPNINSFMEIASHFVGYHDIKKHHRNDHKQFLDLAKKFFNLERYAKIPSWFPYDTGLYFNMLFSKAAK